MSWHAISDDTMLARKIHRCVWCGEMIDAGRAYHRSVGICEGDFQSNAYHLECWTAAMDYFRSGEELFEPHSFERGSTKERSAATMKGNQTK